MSKKSLDWSMNTITTHSMLIDAGVRPVAEVMVNNEDVEKCKSFIKSENLFIVLNPRGKKHTAIYIFKHPCLENVINFTLDKPCNKKALIQWIHGKMFGYSDEEIARFIKETRIKEEAK